MGYTTQRSAIMLGLGVSAISDAGVAFAQNKKSLHEYYRDVQQGRLAVTKGYFLDKEDRSFRKYILDIICTGETKFSKADTAVLEQYTFTLLEDLAADGLVVWDSDGLQVTETGRDFLRNTCSAFDLHLRRRQPSGDHVFSKAV